MGITIDSDGTYVVPDRLFEWLTDLTDEDSHPLTDLFPLVAATSESPLAPDAVVDLALEWLREAREVDWMRPVDATYPHTIETDWDGALAWVERHRAALGAGRLTETWPTPEFDTTEAYRALTRRERVRPVSESGWRGGRVRAAWYGLAP